MAKKNKNLWLYIIGGIILVVIITKSEMLQSVEQGDVSPFDTPAVGWTNSNSYDCSIGGDVDEVNCEIENVKMMVVFEGPIRWHNQLDNPSADSFILFERYYDIPCSDIPLNSFAEEEGWMIVPACQLANPTSDCDVDVCVSVEDAYGQIDFSYILSGVITSNNVQTALNYYATRFNQICPLAVSDFVTYLEHIGEEENMGIENICDINPVIVPTPNGGFKLILNDVVLTDGTVRFSDLDIYLKPIGDDLIVSINTQAYAGIIYQANFANYYYWFNDYQEANGGEAATDSQPMLELIDDLTNPITPPDDEDSEFSKYLPFLILMFGALMLMKIFF